MICSMALPELLGDTRWISSFPKLLKSSQQLTLSVLDLVVDVIVPTSLASLSEKFIWAIAFLVGRGPSVISCLLPSLAFFLDITSPTSGKWNPQEVWYGLSYHYCIFSALTVLASAIYWSWISLNVSEWRASGTFSSILAAVILFFSS